LPVNGTDFVLLLVKLSVMNMRLLSAALMAVFALTFSACSKDGVDNNANNSNPNNPNTSGKADVTMRLTDGPAEYDAVYLDIQAVELTMTGQSAVTLTPVRPGIYDILHFKNGADTLLMRADVPGGNIEQIRLKLGSNNSVVIDGQSYALTTPSGQTSGIKLNLNQTLVAGNAYTFWIDFDAGKSIHQTGNGKYMLKPVIRAYSSLTDGRIKGYVMPLNSFATVYAINGVDTFAAIPETDGFFRIGGLPAASYSLWIDSGIPTLQDAIIPNVAVTYGVENNVGTITLVP
jgi:hypothetical protein